MKGYLSRFFAIVVCVALVVALVAPTTAQVGRSNFSTGHFVQLLIAMGLAPGVTVEHKFGHNGDVDTGVAEVVWDGGDSYTGDNPTVADTVTLVSSSISDDGAPAGVGARTVRIYGLDANWDPQSELVTMDGTTPADSVFDYIRMYRQLVEDSGVGASNFGTITAYRTGTPAHVYSVMAIGASQSLVGAFPIPRGKTGYLADWFGSLAGSNATNVTFHLSSRPFGKTYNTKEIIAVRAGGSSYFTRQYWVPNGPFAEKTDILVKVFADSPNSEVSAGFSVIMVD